MSILDEVNGVQNVESAAENVARETLADVGTQSINPTQEVGKKLADFLKTPTGDGSIESYIDHPMNFDKTKELGQVLRGITGLFGNLNLAIADILIGGMRWMNLKKAGVADGHN